MQLDFEFKLDDFQLEAVEHINNGKSVVVCAPTGAGKTVIAEHAIHKAISENKRIFYTTPLKALSNQKFHDFSKKYGEDKTGLLTGDTSINRSAQIVVMTTEVFRNMLYGTTLGKIEENLKDVRYVVLDEVHYMNDEQRGTVWEESIIYCPTNIQIVALSATIANVEELTGWINSVHSDTALVYTDFRPVPLRHFYFSPSRPMDLLPLFSPGGGLNAKITPEKRQKFAPRQKKKESEVAQLVKVLHKKDMLPAIYFTFSRKKCDLHMEECSELSLLNEFESKRIIQIIDEYIIDNPYLAKSKHLEYLYCGVASHHAGLLPAWKSLVEKLFQQGLIKVVFATETLAAGINMPARSTVISSISKRGDNGHRLLTPSELLQMSGRAGRRGMDEVGYVTIVGTSFQSPEEVAMLVLSDANPLESKFTPSYSMVLNLLQRFNLEESKELILRSFGYFSNTTRLKPLDDEKRRIEGVLKNIDNFKCHHKLALKDMMEFNKYKNMYVEHRKIANTLKRQAKNAKRYNAPEVAEYNEKAKEFLNKMQSFACNNCKLYKKHIKDIEVQQRFEKKLKKAASAIEYEKDIFWKKFVSHAAILEELDYLKDNYPTEKGCTTAAIRAENELFFSEIILQGVLDDLEPSELAGLLCAITTEDVRAELYMPLTVSKPVRKAIADCHQIRRKLWKVQKDHNIETEMYINPYYSPLIEYWVNGGEWDEMMSYVDIGEGDIVRTFKRTVDLLRQLTIIPNVSPKLAQTASVAMTCINREPIDDVV